MVDHTRIEKALRTEQVERAYQQAVRNQIFSPLGALLLTIGLWPYVDHGLLLGWLALLVIASVVRQRLAVAYFAAGDERFGSAHWELRFTVSIVLVSLVWGIGGWLFVRNDNALVDVYTYIFLIGLSGGTAAQYASLGRVSAVAILFILGPASVSMILVGDALHYCLALAGMMFVVAVSRSAKMLTAATRRALELTQQLEEMARVDTLSGIANRRALTEEGIRITAHALRTGRRCAVLILDVDHFKRINDTLGHSAGDAVITALGALLSKMVRADEVVGRIGGEEFAIILPDADELPAMTLAKRVLDAVRNMKIAYEGVAIPITVSIGVTINTPGDDSFQSLLDHADQALYDAKRGGRDRVVLFGR